MVVLVVLVGLAEVGGGTRQAAWMEPVAAASTEAEAVASLGRVTRLAVVSGVVANEAARRCLSPQERSAVEHQGQRSYRRGHCRRHRHPPLQPHAATKVVVLDWCQAEETGQARTLAEAGTVTAVRVMVAVAARVVAMAGVATAGVATEAGARARVGVVTETVAKVAQKAAKQVAPA